MKRTKEDLYSGQLTSDGPDRKRGVGTGFQKNPDPDLNQKDKDQIKDQIHGEKNEQTFVDRLEKGEDKGVEVYR